MIRKNRIKKIGNGHFIPLSLDAMKELGLQTDEEISIDVVEGRLVIQPVATAYFETKHAAEQVVGRYRRSLEKLGREGNPL